MTDVIPPPERDTDCTTEIIGNASEIRTALDVTAHFAPTRLPILLLGDTGTGKELFARRVHELSGRTGAFVDVNCGALPRDLVEALLFGSVRGSYTGALRDSVGLVEEAAGGTLFLDELSSLTREAQAKLLRVLERGEVRRVGEGKKRRVDFRLVAAAHPELPFRVQSGDFRDDLYHRVAGIVLSLPPLASRVEDIPELVNVFARRYGAEVDASATAMLTTRSWSGNVRELKAPVERAAALSSDSIISTEAVLLALQLGASAPIDAVDNSPPIDERRAELERVCRDNEWDATRIASALGVGRTTLFKRLREVGISLRR